MNIEKHLNEADRKRRTHVNDSAHQNASVSVLSSTEVRTRPQRQLPVHDGTGGFDEYSSSRLNSRTLNAEVKRDSDLDDLLSSHSQKVGSCPLVEYLSQNDDYQRSDNLSSMKKKKKKLYCPDVDQTLSPSAADAVNSEDNATGLVIRGIHHSTAWQDRTDIRNTQSNTSLKERFYSDDHSLPALPVAGSASASEKVVLFV